MYVCEVSTHGREKGLHLWDERFPLLRTQDLVFKEDDLLALQHEAVGPGHVWKPWPLASDVRGHTDTYTGLLLRRERAGTHSESTTRQRR